MDTKPILSEKRFGKKPSALTIKKNGRYKILVQPELSQSVAFQIEIYTQPTIAFPVAGVSSTTTRPSEKGFVVAQKAIVRIGLNSKAEKLTMLQFQDTLTLLGKTFEWYHARLPDDSKGFIYKSLIKEIDDSTLNLSFK